jgi:hypothetical protein
MDWNAAFPEGEGNAERGEKAWGEREFRTVELGDKRLEQRLKKVAADLAARPQAPSIKPVPIGRRRKRPIGCLRIPKRPSRRFLLPIRSVPCSGCKGSRSYWRFRTQAISIYSHHPQTRGLGPIGG